MKKPSLLFAASEVYPFAKSGGLADVSYALPKALQSEYDVRVVMPLYKMIDREKYFIKKLNKSFMITLNSIEYYIELYGCTYEGIEYCFIYTPLLCDRENLYGTPEYGYEDNAVRFGIFNYSLVKLLKLSSFDVIHLNDWQCGLSSLLIKSDKAIETKVVYTIHNLAYQGVFEKSVLDDLDIDHSFFNIDGVEFYDKVSFMKAGIAYCDAITTVSPNYAKEILTAEFGCGLEGFLDHHKSKLLGILNGIDTTHFSPSTDTALFKRYTNLSDKKINKSSFLKSTKLKGVNKPLFVFIGRFTWQKGVDLLIDILPDLAKRECNVVILGDGEAEFHKSLKEISESSKNIDLIFGYDEDLSHRIYAAADFLLMPSHFEPCGLNQLIAMNYGAMPIVNHVGGLVDTVQNFEKFDSASKKGYGLYFKKIKSRSFLHTLKKAFEIYEDKKEFNKIIKHNMKCDFSWEFSAKEYIKLYKSIAK